MKYDLHIDLVRDIQASMAALTPTWWEDPDRAHLRCLIRLNVEFFYHLQDEDMNEQSELRYLGNSIFSGIESFCLVSMTYRAMRGDTANQFIEEVVSKKSVKEEFIFYYQKFLAETDFDERCKLILILFRLQLIFTGLTYG